MSGSLLVSNALRTVPIVLGVVLLGIVLRVVWNYFRYYRANPHVVRGLLPAHIWSIGSSYSLLVFLILDVQAQALAGRVNLTYRYLFLVVALCLGLFGMGTMLRHQSYRGHRPTPVRTDVDEFESEIAHKIDQAVAQESQRRVATLVTIGLGALLLTILVVFTLVNFGRLNDLVRKSSETSRLNQLQLEDFETREERTNEFLGEFYVDLREIIREEIERSQQKEVQ